MKHTVVHAVLLALTSTGCLASTEASDSEEDVGEAQQATVGVCSPTTQYCTYAYTPLDYYGGGNVIGQGLAVYQNEAYKICAKVRLLDGANNILEAKQGCNTWDTISPVVSTIIPYYQAAGKRLHTWVHSWVVYADGTTHADRYVASESKLF